MWGRLSLSVYVPTPHSKHTPWPEEDWSVCYYIYKQLEDVAIWKKNNCIILGNVRKIEKDVLEDNSIGQKKLK